MKMIAALMLSFSIFAFVGCCGACRRRESLWIFIITAFVTIPVNIGIIKAIMAFVELHRGAGRLTKLAVCLFMYMVLFSAEEIVFGVIGRMIWKKQYVLKWR